MGSLLIVTGPPGAGKSSVARVLADATDHSVLVEGDAFFAFLATGAIDPWLPASNEQNGVVTEAAARAIGAFVDGGYSTVYDGVMGPWFLDAFVSAAGIDVVDYVILLPPVETCVQRFASRVGHGFTDEAAARHMHAEFVQAGAPARHVIADAGGSPADIAAMIRGAQARSELRHVRG